MISRNKSQIETGFSLIEVLVAIAILGILAAIAVPSFQDFVSDSRQTGVYKDVSSAFRYARSEAIKRSNGVTVCARASDTSCSDDDWNDGLLVFSDSVSDGAILELDGSDEVLRIISIDSSHASIDASALTAADASAVASTAIRFNGRGQTNWKRGTVVICDERGAGHAKAFVMTGSGVGREAYASDSSDGVVVDASGAAVTC
ncbi:GspH/FimT family pseudopilin [bacterium]|nr:GspH/FimT family pseudopilin [bacterium]